MFDRELIYDMVDREIDLFREKNLRLKIVFISGRNEGFDYKDDVFRYLRRRENLDGVAISNWPDGRKFEMRKEFMEGVCLIDLDRIVGRV